MYAGLLLLMDKVIFIDLNNTDKVIDILKQRPDLIGNIPQENLKQEFIYAAIREKPDCIGYIPSKHLSTEICTFCLLKAKNQESFITSMPDNLKRNFFFHEALRIEKQLREAVPQTFSSHNIYYFLSPDKRKSLSSFYDQLQELGITITPPLKEHLDSRNKLSDLFIYNNKAIFEKVDMSQLICHFLKIWDDAKTYPIMQFLKKQEQNIKFIKQGNPPEKIPIDERTEKVCLESVVKDSSWMLFIPQWFRNDEFKNKVSSMKLKKEKKPTIDTKKTSENRGKRQKL